MKKLSTNLLIGLIILPLIGSCGKSSSGNGQQREEEPEGSVDGSTIDGMYQAKFETLNPHINGTIPGSLTLFRKDDKLMTYVRLFAGQPRAWHMQGIYMGKRCPTMADDTNKDGTVDVVEAMNVVGKMIIPLDSNMNSQNAGKNFFPLADLSGYYHYERISSFKRLFADLRTEDLDADDNVVKLTADEKFTWERRVVMVHGVTEETVLPETVVGLGRRRAFQTLPITCGIINKVLVDPGTPDTGEIPGPVADVVEGQDQPAPPEEDTSAGTGGGTVAGTTGTNDTGDGDGEVGDQGGTAGGTVGGTTGRTSGGSSGGTTGRVTTGGSSGGTTGRSSGGFIGGFIGGSSGGRTGGTSGGGTTGETTGGSTTGETTGGTTGGTSGGFIGGFIGGSDDGE
ncbi:MAG: hypothetical protein H0V66_14005 [Bdellovibrionales bacterium]|nr:hypothetical protein [Bdellovibrionales bacterium]